MAEVPQHLRRFASLLEYRRPTGDEATKQYGQATDYALATKVLAFTLGDPTNQYYDVSWPDVLAPLLRVYIADRDWLLELAKIVRKIGKVKQGILIASQFFTKDEIADVLSDFPVTQLVKFADMARKNADAFGGLGRRKKEGLAKLLNEWGIDRNEFQAIKYTSKMRQLLKLVHPKPSSPKLEAIWGWVVRKREAPAKRIRVVEKIARKEVDAEEAVQLALEYDLPWEVVRRNIKVSEIPDDLFEEAVKKIMSPIDRALQAHLIVRKLGERFISEHLMDLYKHTNVYYLAKMALGLYRQGLIGTDTGYEIADEIHYRLPSELKQRQLILDGSGSMEAYWEKYRVQEIGLALAPKGEIVVFSNSARRYVVDFEWWAKYWEERVPFWGTCISCGLEVATSDKATLLTDEQHNVGSIVEMVEQSPVEDLVYIAVGTYSSTILPQVAVGPRKVAIGFGDSLPAIIATLQASELLSQKKMWEEPPAVEEVEEVLSKYTII